MLHPRNLVMLREQFDQHRPADLRPSENTVLASPLVGTLRNPDLTYIPWQAPQTPGNEVPAELAALVVEIVSPTNPENDWVGKVRNYPPMNIPLCLLVDPRDGSVTLFSEPCPDGYHTRRTRAFGEPVPLPHPFDFTLDTATLPGYPGPTHGVLRVRADKPARAVHRCGRRARRHSLG